MKNSKSSVAPKIRPDWWPSPLQPVMDFQPWDHDPVVVAQIRSFDEAPHTGYRRTFTALIPLEDVATVQKNLATLDNSVSTSGPRPAPAFGAEYKPSFWIGAVGLTRDRFEPLVLAWSMHNKTALALEPGFLMTYGLCPRNEGSDQFWDDPAEPAYGVASVSAPSVWEFPNASHAWVAVSRDYLQDYLTLRGVALVQVYYELHYGAIDGDIAAALREEEVVEIKMNDRTFQLNRLPDGNTVAAQVWGARFMAFPGPAPVSGDPRQMEALRWPGFAEPVTKMTAEQMGTTEFVYIEDQVLADFEGQLNYRVNPETGSVAFGTQWSVGYCDRVDRSLIRIELKKLYEGTRAHVVRHWHRFAVEPLPTSAYPEATQKRNIGIRARELVYATVGLGEALARLENALGGTRKPEDFVGLRRKALDYSGWWTSQDLEPLGWHVPVALTMDRFLDRCGKIDQVVVEHLNEAALRDILRRIEVPDGEYAKFGTLKLLDLIVRLTQVATKTGLRLRDHGQACWERLVREGTEPKQPIALLFANYDIRLLQAHHAANKQKDLVRELRRFGVQPGAEAPGYGAILDQVYDSLAAQIAEAATKIDDASR